MKTNPLYKNCGTIIRATCEPTTIHHIEVRKQKQAQQKKKKAITKAHRRHCRHHHHHWEFLRTQMLDFSPCCSRTKTVTRCKFGRMKLGLRSIPSPVRSRSIQVRNIISLFYIQWEHILVFRFFLFFPHFHYLRLHYFVRWHCVCVRVCVSVTFVDYGSRLPFTNEAQLTQSSWHDFWIAQATWRKYGATASTRPPCIAS